MRWALATSSVATLLGVAVNLATDREASWLAWLVVLVLTVASAGISVAVDITPSS
jgi:hypothetical protein